MERVKCGRERLRDGLRLGWNEGKCFMFYFIARNGR